jgi:hypothetical protein
MGFAAAASIVSGGGLLAWRRRQTDTVLTAPVAPTPVPTHAPSPLPTATIAPTAPPQPLPEPAPEPSPAEESIPEAASTEEVAPVATILTALCREAWGAAPAAAGRPHQIQQITVHHSAGLLTNNRAVPARLLGYQRNHQQRGWVDLAYHWIVDAEGNLYEGRSTDYAGDTATDYDPAGHFLALCDGNFEEQALPPAQLDGLARLLAWAVQRYGLGVELISGHRDHAATACPGAALYDTLQTGELIGRVQAYLDAGPIHLERVCGGDAEAHINRIEQG